MKKVVATLVVKDNEIVNLSVNDNKGSLINLTPATPSNHFNKFKELYECVLNILKNNGYYTHSYKAFGSAWYNIQVIDLDNPSAIAIFSADKISQQ